MLRLALACLVLSASAVRADECDGLARQIADAVGGKVGRRSGPSIDVRMPGAIKLDVTCRAEPIVQASSAEAQPSAAFFNDLALASQILIGEPVATVAPIIARAHATSLAERRKSFIQQNGWSASCYTDPSSSVLRTLCSVGRIPPG